MRWRAPVIQASYEQWRQEQSERSWSNQHGVLGEAETRKPCFNNVEWENWHLKAVLWSPHACCSTCMASWEHTHTLIIITVITWGYLYFTWHYLPLYIEWIKEEQSWKKRNYECFLYLQNTKLQRQELARNVVYFRRKKKWKVYQWVEYEMWRGEMKWYNF